MKNFFPEFLFPIILYAETHYKFKGIYSRFFKREPEIIADAPIRVEPGQAIPVVLLVKDAFRYPIRLKSVTIELRQGDAVLQKHDFLLNENLDSQRYWHRLFHINAPQGVAGGIEIDVIIQIEINGRTKTYRNDNYRISSHLPLRVHLAADSLPRFPGWHFGDFHYHSNYTEDQVEFGAPLPVAAEMARAMGLSFFAVTDHSYDLDDREDSWVINDPALPKWMRLREEVAALNAQFSGFAILPGEEVSAGNSRNRNVHLLIINDPRFYSGKGDGAEQWFSTAPDLAIPQILDAMAPEALALAGHPEMPFPFLQWLLIRRGRWGAADFAHARLHGMQLWNGEFDQSFHRGSTNWIRMLLGGRRMVIVAGNDAHGNFNRFRQIGFPFFTMRETNGQLFGKMRTAVQLTGEVSVPNIIGAVKKGAVQITTGPVVDLTARNERGENAGPGDEIAGRRFEIICKTRSTPEFGKLKQVRIILGELGQRRERTLLERDAFQSPFDDEVQVGLSELTGASYIRVEVTSEMVDQVAGRCFSNPVWFNKIK
ncbi:MAG: CehA/McbA family metallohydrolase [Candidatus Zhuqueibacterota bacterium]